MQFHPPHLQLLSLSASQVSAPVASHAVFHPSSLPAIRPSTVGAFTTKWLRVDRAVRLRFLAARVDGANHAHGG